MAQYLNAIPIRKLRNPIMDACAWTKSWQEVTHAPILKFGGAARVSREVKRRVLQLDGSCSAAPPHKGVDPHRQHAYLARLTLSPGEGVLQPVARHCPFVPCCTERDTQKRCCPSGIRDRARPHGGHPAAANATRSAVATRLPVSIQRRKT